jgi:membrane-bound metal-dependent hydrolase YbcI (DUF457 family)
MSNYKGHIAGSVVATFILLIVVMLLPFAWANDLDALFNSWQYLASLFVVAILFGLWPDVDTNSKGQDIFMIASVILDIWLILNKKFEIAAYFGLFVMLPVLGKHRGWTHKKWAMLVVPLPILVVSVLLNSGLNKVGIMFYAAAVVGYFSHLLLDGLIFKKIRIKN